MRAFGGSVESIPSIGMLNTSCIRDGFDITGTVIGIGCGGTSACAQEIVVEVEGVAVCALLGDVAGAKFRKEVTVSGVFREALRIDVNGCTLQSLISHEL